MAKHPSPTLQVYAVWLPMVWGNTRQAWQRPSQVSALLERGVADVRQAIEVLDVSAPATVIRYTGNWQGSMEGWLLTPSTGFRPSRSTLLGSGHASA